AFGTASSAFVQASLYQLIAAARLPGSGISEIAVNASLAFIEGAKPKGEVECALVVQMACTHTAAMSVLGTFAGVYGHGRDVPLKASAAARLMRAYATQVEKGRVRTAQVAAASPPPTMLQASLGRSRGPNSEIGNTLRTRGTRRAWGQQAQNSRP